MKLYYSPGACSLADHIALAEAGLPYDLVKVDLKTKKTENGEDFSAINPKGYVPTLELDDGERLTENIAVLSFIADKSGRLMPSQGLAHWRVLETTAFVSTELHKSFKPFFSPDSTDDDKKKAAELLGKRFGVLDQHVSGDAFVAGSEITVADCYLWVMLMWAIEKAKINVPQNLTAYYQRLKQRPAFQRALSEEGLS